MLPLQRVEESFPAPSWLRVVCGPSLVLLGWLTAGSLQTAPSLSHGTFPVRLSSQGLLLKTPVILD